MTFAAETMRQKQIRMIAVDIDGTLLGLDGKVSQKNREAISLAEAAGAEVVIATGRRHSYAMRVLRGLGLREDGVLVSSNGAVVRTLGSGTATGTPSRLIEKMHMAPEGVEILLGLLREFRNALVVTFDKLGVDGEDARGALVVEGMADLNNNIGKWMEANEPFIEQVDPIEASLERGEAPIQMMLCGTVERMRLAEARLVEDSRVAAVGEVRAGGLIQLNRTEYPERDLSILDILPAGCSKGAALLRLAASRGIDASEMMAIGDNWNDLSMLEVAGHPVLMANAPDDLLAFARTRGWRIGLRHEQDGVAEAMETALAAGIAAG